MADQSFESTAINLLQFQMQMFCCLAESVIYTKSQFGLNVYLLSIGEENDEFYGLDKDPQFSLL